MFAIFLICNELAGRDFAGEGLNKYFCIHSHALLPLITTNGCISLISIIQKGQKGVGHFLHKVLTS